MGEYQCFCCGKWFYELDGTGQCDHCQELDKDGFDDEIAKEKEDE